MVSLLSSPLLMSAREKVWYQMPLTVPTNYVESVCFRVLTGGLQERSEEERMKRLSCMLLLALLFLVVSQTGLAAVFDVLKGSDFLTTQPGTVFAGVPFTAVPFGPGSTDMIVQ